MKHTLTIGAPRADNFVPIALQKACADGPTSGSWSKVLSVGATGALYFEYWQYFGIACCEYWQHFEVLC